MQKKPTISGIVNDHVKQQIQPGPDDLFANATELHPDTPDPLQGAESGITNFGYQPDPQQGIIAEDLNLSDFEEGPVSIDSLSTENPPEVLEPVQPLPADPVQPVRKKPDLNKPKTFTNYIRANDYLKSNGLQDSHEIVRGEDGIATVQPKSPAPVQDPVEPTQPPNIIDSMNVSDFVKNHLQYNRQIADNLGVTQEIEDLAAQGLVANEIYDALKDNKLSKFRNRADALDLVRATRTSLGIPSQEAGEEADNFKSWLDEYKQRKGVDQEVTAQPEAPVEPVQPTASFADQIREAHLNNPNTKPQLIEDEIAKGRSRADVLKEVGDIVKNIGKAPEPVTPAPEPEATAPEAVTPAQPEPVEPTFEEKKESQKQEYLQKVRDAYAKDPASVNEVIDKEVPMIGTSTDRLLNIAEAKGVVANLEKHQKSEIEQKTDENGIQENDAPEGIKSGDIGRGSDGKPFLSKNAANRGLKLRDVEKTHEVVEISPSNFVLRAKETVPGVDKPQESDNPYQKYDDLAKQYGRSIKPDGIIVARNGQDTAFKIQEKNGLLHIKDVLGNLAFSGATTPESLGKFLEDYWYDKKDQSNQKEQAPAENSVLDTPAPEEMKKGDVGRKSDNQPFASATAAKTTIKKQGLDNSHEVVQLAPSQFVLREKAKSEDDSLESGSEELALADLPHPPFQRNDTPGTIKKKDIGRASDNKPFANKSAATTTIKKEGLSDTHEVVQVAPSQFVLREKLDSEQEAE